MGLGLDDIGRSIFANVTRMQTINLVLVVGLIMVMSKLMEESGHMIRLVKSFTRLSKDARTVGAVMSALIGLLPMPGGAVFSAPMVEAALRHQVITNEQKTALNYWFRHIWEYWWPLYPGVILVVALLDVETWRYMAVAAPLTIIAILAGIIFILRPLGKTVDQYQGPVSRSAVTKFMWEMMPIIIVVFTIICLAGLIALLGHNVRIPSLLPILLGLMAAIVWVGIINHISLRQFRSALIRKDLMIMLLLILAIMVFRGVMEDSHAVEYIRNELIAYGIPAILIITAMPFLSGFITGIAIGFVGASFPLIIPLFHTTDIFNYLLHAVLAYTFGYMGMMLSPVHVCLLVTKDYFHASLLNSYPYIIKPVLMVIMTVMVVFALVIAL
jgi:integral membrane protein (TIGR00529 family)